MEPVPAHFTLSTLDRQTVKNQKTCLQTSGEIRTHRRKEYFWGSRAAAPEFSELENLFRNCVSNFTQSPQTYDRYSELFSLRV